MSSSCSVSSSSSFGSSSVLIVPFPSLVVRCSSCRYVEATSRKVHWVHIKGHSSDGGNDRADELVQWGKSRGPYCRIREGGSEGDSLHGATTMTAVTWQSHIVLAPRYDRTPARQGLEAANVAIDVFNSLGGEYLSVIGNGDSLEGQIYHHHHHHHHHSLLRVRLHLYRGLAVHHYFRWKYSFHV